MNALRRRGHGLGMVRAFDVCLHVLKLLFMSHPTFRILTLLLFDNPLPPSMFVIAWSILRVLILIPCVRTCNCNIKMLKYGGAVYMAGGQLTVMSSAFTSCRAVSASACLN